MSSTGVRSRLWPSTPSFTLSPAPVTVTPDGRRNPHSPTPSCTGHAIITPAEDAPSSELAAQFATNVHGTLHILQSTLPYFRTRRIPGRYLIFSSTAGALGIPGLAPYCATKYAVEGLVESMLYEVNVWGIKATLVEPGFVRDDDDDDDDEVDPSPRDPTVDAPSSPSNTAATPYAHFTLRASPSPPYTHPTHPTHHATRILSWLGPAGQPTSSSRSAELVWQLAHCRYPPLRLLLGAYAVDSVRDRLRCVTEEIEDWKGLRFGEGAPGAGSGGAGQVEEASGEGGTEDNEGDGGETYEQGPSSTRASFAEPGGAGPSSQTSPRSVHFGGSERSSSFGGAGHAAGEGRRKDSGVTEGSMG